MAKFIFKMQNILDVKLKLEDQAKSVYASAIGKLEEEKEKKRLLDQRKKDYENKLTSMMYEKLQVMEIRQLEEAVEVIKYRIQEQMIAIKSAELRVEQARIALNVAMVERKTYEKLKEKEFEEFKREVNAQEKKEIDELVSYTFSKPKEMV